VGREKNEWDRKENKSGGLYYNLEEKKNQL
jgi:hypothetical protein